MKMKSRPTIKKLKQKGDGYHGGCRYTRTRPPLKIKSANIEITFEEVLKLSVALTSCILNLNRFNRRKTAGRNMGVVLVLKTGNETISVIEKKLKKK